MSEEQTSPIRVRSLRFPFSLPRTNLLRDDAQLPRAPKAHEPRGFDRIISQLRLFGRLNPGPNHRADIDGLRAIAVIAVILMHAGVSALSGGFLGVDVFFVISGYLLYQQIAVRFQERKFAFFAFYGRRLRRTLPALYFVGAATLAAGVFILMPGDLDALARSTIAAALCVSNLFFAAQSGYFDSDAISKPMLHTWSLGVEEQFYLIAPLIPFVLCRLSVAGRRAALLALLGADLAFCIVLQSLAPTITFFMMAPRLWEFLIGALVAEYSLPAVRRRWLVELGSAAALAALLLSLFCFSEMNAQPGLITLVPCLATAVLIHVGSGKPFVTRLLGSGPLAFCGLISYSLYLWHWPLIVYARYVGLPPSATAFVLGALLLTGLSLLSWKYIETPFRDPASALRRHAAPILVSALALLLASGSALVLSRGLPQRFSPRIAAITSYYDYADRRDFREGTCFITSKYGSGRQFGASNCLRTSAAQPNYLLIGDSQAAHLWAGFSRVFRNVHFLQATASGCKPTLTTEGRAYCVDLMHKALIEFLPSAKIDGVIFSASWNDEDAAPLKATLAYAKKFAAHVIVLGKIPTYDFSLPDLLGRSLAEGRPDLLREHTSLYPKHVDMVLRGFIDPGNFISLVDLLCPENQCILFASDNVPLQFDESHLTTEGSVLVAQKLAALVQFAPLVAPPNGRASR
jgi:peptidoglycan/LPS O-acetylase OafA/YrhL